MNTLIAYPVDATPELSDTLENGVLPTVSAAAEQAMRTLLAGTIRDLAPAYDKYPRGIPPPPVPKAASKRPRRN